MMKKIILTFVICSLGIACGKKINNSKSGSGGGGDRDDRNDHISDTLRKFIQKQSHECSDELTCNESVAKLVVVDRQNVKYCTGTLVGPDVILTSSSCLPKSLRVPSLNCKANVFAIFPGTTFHKKEIVNCEHIVSSDTNESGDPALWKSDFAFIKLDRRVNRKKINISRKGLKEDIPYRSYKVDYENDYDSYQKFVYCYPVYNSYANPFSTDRYSPIVSVRECENLIGNSGAPIIDFSGNLVGIFSGKLDKGVSSYISNSNLMIEPMAPIHHIANTACVKLPKHYDVAGVNPECKKSITIDLLDKYRSKILKSRLIHKKNMDDIKDELETPVKYFKWKVDFFVDSKGRSYEPHFVKPKCFFDIKTWIGEFTKRGGRIRPWATVKVDVPNFKLETKLDRELKPISYITDTGTKTYTISFNPRYAYYQHNTVVQVKSEFLGREREQRFDDITNSCSQYWE